MKIDAFHQPKVDAVKFDVIGASVDGVIVGEPELGDDKFNPDRKMLTIRLMTDDGIRVLFARNAMLDAIGEAVAAAGVDEIAQGGGLRVEYAEDRVLNSGRSMKVYRADYGPPPPMGDAILGETGDWPVA